MLRSLIVSSALATLSAAPLAAQVSDVFIAPVFDESTYGILCFYSEAAPDTPLTAAEEDEIWSDETRRFEIIRGSKTLLVPAIQGVSFGIAASYPEGVSNLATTRVTRTFPDGAVIEESFPVTIDDEVSVDVWYLDAADGPMTGTYHFRSAVGDTLLYEMTFEVVPAEAYTGDLPDCVASR